jgi:signal transduction histidine kinase
VGLADDVTDRRLVDAMRDDLVQTLVHDLRSPLTSVSAALGLLSQHAEGDVAAGEVVSAARLGVARLLKLIDSILDVNRLEQGAMPVAQRALELSPLLQDLVRAAEPRAREKGVQLELRLQPLPAAFADPELLVRVLENLVGNALKFTAPGGAVWIAAEAGEQAVRLSVGDTGPGISEEVRDRLFGKFVTGPHPARGSGLGLAFCRLAVQAQGGQIWAETPAGGGTVMRLTLPRATE